MSTVSNIKDGLQLALELANAGSRIEDVNKIIELQQNVVQLLDEDRQLRARVAELEGELAMDSQLVRQGFSYYLKEDDGSETGPVCPGCYKRDRVASQLVRAAHSPDGLFCPRCQEKYYIRNQAQ